jgi:hypothetical protein
VPVLLAVSLPKHSSKGVSSTPKTRQNRKLVLNA